ncbi:MAG: hypothetical protein GY795_28220 [Desulfobacterales bacterium]|nr:hypothetical protein [Desulfobacterales bacterium]
MIRYILGTDLLSLHLRGHEQMKKHLLAVPPEQTGITIITVEVIRGRLAQILVIAETKKLLCESKNYT